MRSRATILTTVLLTLAAGWSAPPGGRAARKQK
jgi:hypothetical protein